MKKIGIVYEITNNPYFDQNVQEYSNRLSEYVYPSEINSICDAISENGYEFGIIDGPNGLIDSIPKQNYDLIFNKSIGFKGLERKITIPAICQLNNMPFIGSGAYSMTLARHKYHTNRLLHGLGFRVPVSYIYKYDDILPSIVKYPIIVKPNDESDSLGISDKSVCYNIQDLKNVIEELRQNFNPPFIIEEFIPGEEWKVAVIGNDRNVSACGIINTLKNGATMENTLQTRDDHLSAVFSHSEVSHPLKEKALHIAELIHVALGLCDYSRCDFRIGTDGELYCMEVSTHPELSKRYSSFLDAAKQKYGDYNNSIFEIIKTAERRYNID